MTTYFHVNGTVSFIVGMRTDGSGYNYATRWISPPHVTENMAPDRLPDSEIPPITGEHLEKEKIACVGMRPDCRRWMQPGPTKERVQIVLSGALKSWTFA